MTQYDLSLRDYWRIIRRRKWVVITVAVACGVFSFAMALVMAPSPLYQAATSVRFEVSLNLAGLLLKDVFAISPEGDLDTQAALVTSFPVMSRAAKKLGVIPQEATPEDIRARYQDVVSDVTGQVAVKRVAGTSFIEISVTSPDPMNAAQVANRVAEAFQEENIASRTQQIVEARRFIEAQLDEVAQRLRKSEERMRAFQESDWLLPIPDEARATANRLATQEAEYDRITKAISATEAQLRLLEEGRIENRPSGFSADSDPALAKLYASLSELTVERENLLLTLRPLHPQVKAVDARITVARQILIQALSTQLRGLRANALEARNVIASVKVKQAALPAAALEAARIERDLKVDERIFSLLKERLQEALIKEKEQGAEVSIVTPATVPTVPINPHQPATRAKVGLLVGLLTGLLLAFVLETLDTSIGAIDEVESLMETRVLGVIPYLDSKEDLSEEAGEAFVADDAEDRRPFLTTLFAPKSHLAEAFRGLRTNLVFATLERDLKTILVTGGSQMEGKTTVAINLGITLAQLGKKTLLVEADLRQPFIRRAFGLAKAPGLTEVVLESASLAEVTLGFADLMLGKAGMERLLDSPGMENLFVLPSGYPPSNPSELLSSQGLVKVLSEARQHYDYVILDSSPILPVPDAPILGSRADGALLVIRVGHMPRVALRRAKALLDATNTRLIGVCLTGVKADLSSDYAQMASYGYQYGPKTEKAQAWWKLGRLANVGRGLVAIGERSVVWGAVLILAFLVLATGISLWVSKQPIEPVSNREVARPVPARPPAAVPKAQEGRAPRPTSEILRLEPEAPPAPLPLNALPKAFTVLVGVGVSGTVSIEQFGTRAEAEAYGRDLVRAGLIKSFTVGPLPASGP